MTWGQEWQGRSIDNPETIDTDDSGMGVDDCHGIVRPAHGTSA